VPDIDIRPPLPLRAPADFWTVPIADEPTLVAPRTFTFLNETREVDADWDDPSWSKLWRYNLHYFDDLNARESDSRSEWHREILRRWVQENPPTVGTAWEPYPTSLRIVNWIKYALSGGTLGAEQSLSLSTQIRWLSRRLERHLLGNHLLTNAKALVFGGLFFDGDEAGKWLKLGLHILREQLPEQILSDGGHFELSPMYHAVALEDVLDLYNVLQAYSHASRGHEDFGRSLRNTAARMFRWARVMTHPDGEIAFFNDACLGVGPTLAELSSYAVRLGLPPGETTVGTTEALPDSGYVRVSHPPFTAIIDVARVGPDYLPGHAHADTLSFELSVGRERVVVNSGISEYGISPERLRQRGTSAHSTVLVDGMNSSDVWSGFRVGRRAYPRDLAIEEQANETIVRCTHDGYQRLLGGVVHSREWRFTDDFVEVRDRVDGPFRTAKARFFLAPWVSVLSEDPCQLEFNGGKMVFSSDGLTVVSPATWHPRFGVVVNNKCLQVEFLGADLISVFSMKKNSSG
jgi:uncharacterized heparinase superfamily protein